MVSSELEPELQPRSPDSFASLLTIPSEQSNPWSHSVCIHLCESQKFRMWLVSEDKWAQLLCLACPLYVWLGKQCIFAPQYPQLQSKWRSRAHNDHWKFHIRFHTTGLSLADMPPIMGFDLIRSTKSLELDKRNLWKVSQLSRCQLTKNKNHSLLTVPGLPSQEGSERKEHKTQVHTALLTYSQW